jgi:hypothetical protein
LRGSEAALARQIDVKFKGETVPAYELDFETEKEPWSVYRLEDGTVLRMKNVVAKVSKIIDRYKADGTPIYTISATGVMMMEVPDHLKQPKNE